MTSHRHAEAAMGTVFSFELRDPTGPGGPTDPGGGGFAAAAAEALGAAVRWLHWVDDTFSTYKPDSEISRLNRGEMGVGQCHPEVREILEWCEVLHVSTGGYFDVRATGRLDPSGIVKGWAIERTSALLCELGWPDHCIDGGGDVRLRGRPGRPGPGRPGPPGRTPDPGRAVPDRTLPDRAVPNRAAERWQVAITHPFRVDAFCAVLAVAEGAVATSGIYQRGFHVVDPHRRQPATALAAVTVVGRELVLTDAYATAALAMGADAPGWLATLPDHEALVIDAAGHGWRSAGFGRLLISRMGS